MKRRFIADVSLDAALFLASLTLLVISAGRDSQDLLVISALMTGFFLSEVLVAIRHYTIMFHRFKKAYRDIEDKEFRRGFERGLNAKTYTERIGKPRRYERDH